MKNEFKHDKPNPELRLGSKKENKRTFIQGLFTLILNQATDQPEFNFETGEVFKKES